MKLKLLVALVTIFLLTFGASYAQNYEMTLDHVDGLVEGETDILEVGTDITFYIRFTTPGAPNEANIKGSSNGFRVYSTGDATWTPITWSPYYDESIPPFGAWVYPYEYWGQYYNGAVKLNDFSVTGEGADTIGFAGYSDPSSPPYSEGIPPGFSEVVYTITTQVDAGQVGEELCLDSCFYPPENEWLWSTDTGVAGVSTGDVYPEWNGPHCYTIAGGSDVTEREPDLPDVFALSQNYPNPFNPTTTIYFDIPVRSHVNLTIYNVLGQSVKTLVDEDLAAGKYEETWEGTSDGGANVATGIYFYKIEAESFVETKKMMLLK